MVEPTGIRHPRVRQRPTAREVAAASGVSPATVSNVLNGTGRVSEATAERVLAAVHDLGHVPWATERAGARGGTGLIGLTLTSYGSLLRDYTVIPYYAELVLGAIDAARERGYLLVTLPGSLSSWAWLSTPVDGIVHVEPRPADPVRAVLARRALPMVFAGRPVAPVRSDHWVDTDHALAVALLLDHLVATGARRPAVIIPDHDDAYPSLVREGCRVWSSRHGIPVDVVPFSLATGYRAAEMAVATSLLAQRARPDAVVGVYNDSGRHLAEAVEAAGLRVGVDVQVGCLSDDPAYGQVEPRMPAVSLAPREVATQAVGLLVDLVHGRATERTRTVQPRLRPVPTPAPVSPGRVP